MINKIDCPKCKGKGKIEAYSLFSGGRCYDCNGTGKVTQQQAKKYQEDCEKIKNFLEEND